MKNENIGNFEEKSYTECPLYKKMTEGRYPWGSDEDKVLEYCANDVAIIVELMTREKQKELEDKADKYEKILVDICDALDLDLKRSWKDNFDECIRKMDIIDELKAENSKLKEEIKALKSDIDYKDTQLGAIRLGRRKDDKRWNDLNKNFCLPLCNKLYGTTKVNKTYEVILSDISDLKDRADGNYKASIRKDELIQDYREKLKVKDNEINFLNSKFDKLGEYYRTDEKLIDNIQKVIFPQEEGSDYTYSYDEILDKVKELNAKIEVLDERNTNQFVIIGEKDKKINTLLNTNKGLTDKIGSLKNKIVSQQSTHYKQCSRILELETMVNKLQSGEYDDILAKDIEIKSLRAKYEDAMAGWKDAIDTNDKQIEEFTRRYNIIAKKLNDIHDILKEESDNE